MRTALWIMVLFAAAVALAQFVGHNPGSLTVFWPPYRISLSVNLALLLLLALFALVYGALRALAAVQALPLQARRWRAQQRERSAHALLLQAQAQLQAGRYLRARKAAENVLAHESALTAAGETLPHAATLRAQAHLAVAESAHALRDVALRNTHWQQALSAAAQAGNLPELGESLHLQAARWAAQDDDPAAALSHLQNLPGGAARRTAALRLRLQAARQLARHAEALDTARLLAKHGAFSPEAARKLLCQISAEQMAATQNADQLRALWAAHPLAEQAWPELALRAARRLLALGGPHARTYARQWLRPAWDALLAQSPELHEAQAPNLIATLDAALTPSETDPPDAHWLARIEEAVSQPHPSAAMQPLLQYLAGKACLHHGLWGKARQLLAPVADHLPTAQLCRNAWLALAQLAEVHHDPAAASAAWQRAAHIGLQEV